MLNNTFNKYKLSVLTSEQMRNHIGKSMFQIQYLAGFVLDLNCVQI